MVLLNEIVSLQCHRTGFDTLEVGDEHLKAMSGMPHEIALKQDFRNSQCLVLLHACGAEQLLSEPHQGMMIIARFHLESAFCRLKPQAQGFMKLD